MNADQLLRAVAGRSHDAARRRPKAAWWRRCDRADFARVAASLHAEWGLPLDLLFATDDRADGRRLRRARRVRASTDAHHLLEIATDLPADAPVYDSLTRQVMAAHWYERYAQDMFGIRADGHPDGRRLVHHENVPAGTHPLRKDFAWDTQARARERAVPDGTRRGRRHLPDPGRADSRRHHRAGPLPVQRRRRAHHHARGQAVLHPQGRREAARGPDGRRRAAARRARLGRLGRVARAGVLPGGRERSPAARSPSGRARCASSPSSSSGSRCTCTTSRTSAGWAPATR